MHKLTLLYNKVNLSPVENENDDADRSGVVLLLNNGKYRFPKKCQTFKKVVDVIFNDYFNTNLLPIQTVK